jgi:4-hydroxybenzoate polyprenyltransferase
MNWPQLVLGLAFNWGALMGWTAVHGEISLQHVLPLYSAGVCWTLVYDTLYGYQDIKDDRKLGLKSTALTFGDKPQVILSLLASGVVAGLSLSGMQANMSPIFYAGVGGVGAHLLWQIWTAKLDDPNNLWTRFSSNRYTGALIAASIVAGHF